MNALVPPVPAPRALLVRLPNPAGDVVLATPALRALRRALPDTRIVVSGRTPALDLIDGLADFDEAHFILGAVANGPGAPLRLGRAWRELGVDAVLLLTGSFSSALAARASGAPVRVGYARHGRRSLLTHVLEVPLEGKRPKPEPMRTHYLRLASLFGGADDGLPPRLVVTQDGEDLVLERVTAERIPFGVVAVSPGAAFGASKVYPVALLAEAVRRVRKETGLVPLVLVGPGEEALGAELVALVGPPVASTHRRVAKWSEAKALLRHSDLLITPDAGPRHVAAALGVPVVCLMGPTDPRWSAGDEATTTIVRREDLDCLGCHLRSCPIGHPCMLGLSPHLVVRACVDRLAATPRPGSIPGVAPAPPREPDPAPPSPGESAAAWHGAAAPGEPGRLPPR